MEQDWRFCILGPSLYTLIMTTRACEAQARLGKAGAWGRGVTSPSGVCADLRDERGSASPEIGRFSPPFLDAVCFLVRGAEVEEEEAVMDDVRTRFVSGETGRKRKSVDANERWAFEEGRRDGGRVSTTAEMRPAKTTGRIRHGIGCCRASDDAAI